MGTRAQHRVVTTWVHPDAAARLRTMADEGDGSVSAIVARIVADRAQMLELLEPAAGARGATVAVYLAKPLIRSVDRAAEVLGTTRSQVIAAAIADELR